MANTIASIVIDFKAKTASIKKATKALKQDAQDIGSRFKKAMSSVSKFAKGSAKSISNVRKKVLSLKSALVALLGVKAIETLTSSLIKNNKAVKEFSIFADTLGVSVNKLQEFEFAARSAGFETEKMLDVLKDVQDKFGDAFATGGGEAANVLNDLGVSLDQFKDRGPIDKLILLSEVTQNLSKAKRVFVFEAIANDASKLLPLLDKNAAKLKALRAEFNALGLAFTQVQVNNAKVFSGNINRLAIIWRTFTRMLSAELAPAFEPLFKWIDRYIKESGGMRAVTQNIAKAIAGFGKSAVLAFGEAINASRRFIASLKKDFLEAKLFAISAFRDILDFLPGGGKIQQKLDNVAAGSIKSLERIKKEIQGLNQAKNPFQSMADSIGEFQSNIGKDDALANTSQVITDLSRAMTSSEKRAKKESEKKVQKTDKWKDKLKLANKELMKAKNLSSELASKLGQVSAATTFGGAVSALGEQAKRVAAADPYDKDLQKSILSQAQRKFGALDINGRKENIIKLEVTVDEKGVIKPVIKSTDFKDATVEIIKKTIKGQAKANNR